MGRIYFCDILANNFCDFWINSTKFDDILDTVKPLILAALNVGV